MPETQPGPKEEKKDLSRILAQKGATMEKVKELLQKSEISLWLDHYDDIFSDFDPRPYSQRGISDDFLKEARKAVREVKPGVLELRFLVPGNHRRADHEAMIRKRLREHFKKHADLLHNEQKGMRRKGAIVSVMGFLLLIIAATIEHYHKDSFLWSLVAIAMEPAGWFSIWMGLDYIISKSKEKVSEKEFYRNMAKAEIKFDAY